MNKAFSGLAQKNIKELRFILCQTSPSSSGLRNWINKNYVDLKSNNPDTSVIVRECENVEPFITFRYDLGVERKVVCEFATTDEVDGIVESLVNDSELVKH